MPDLPMREIWVIHYTKLIVMGRFFFLCKEAILGETAFSSRFRDKINGFLPSTHKGALLKKRTRGQISVIRSIVKQDANSVLISTLCHNRHDNTTIFMCMFRGTLGLLSLVQVVNS